MPLVSIYHNQSEKFWFEKHLKLLSFCHKTSQHSSDGGKKLLNTNVLMVWLFGRTEHCFSISERLTSTWTAIDSVVSLLRVSHLRSIH